MRLYERIFEAGPSRLPVRSERSLYPRADVHRQRWRAKPESTVQASVMTEICFTVALLAELGGIWLLVSEGKRASYALVRWRDANPKSNPDGSWDQIRQINDVMERLLGSRANRLVAVDRPPPQLLGLHKSAGLVGGQVGVEKRTIVDTRRQSWRSLRPLPSTSRVGKQRRQTSGARYCRRMLFGYARISTADQNPDHQIDALLRAGVARDNIHLDTASGAKAGRPQLDLALKLLRAGDTLKITRLDRLGRSVLHLVTLGAELRERGVEVVGAGGSARPSHGRPSGRSGGAVAAVLVEDLQEPLDLGVGQRCGGGSGGNGADRRPHVLGRDRHVRPSPWLAWEACQVSAPPPGRTAALRCHSPVTFEGHLAVSLMRGS